MLALRTAPPVFSAAEAELIVHEVYGLAVSVTPLSGERDCNFRGRSAEGPEYVLKILGGPQPVTADCQVCVLRHLAEQDSSLPVPRIVATLQGADLGVAMQDDVAYATCLTGYLTGDLGAEVAFDAPLATQVGRMLAQLGRALHGFFHPGLAQTIAWDVRRLPELIEFAALIESSATRARVARVSGRIKELLPALRGLRSQAIHGDCHGGNLLIDSSGKKIAGILDFGDMIHAPLVMELAVAMAETAADPLTYADALINLVAGYTSLQELRAADIDALYDLVTARHAVTLLVHAWRGQHDERGARLLDTAATTAATLLELLTSRDRDAWTEEWHRAAGTASETPWAAIDLGKRHRLLGAGAELFYEQPLHLVRGEGVWLYDTQGRAYLDVYNNVPHVGHCHPTVVRAIQRQTAVLVTHTRYLHERILEYAEALTARCPAHLNACIFVNSGSEANDVAWRMARFATGQRGGLVLAHAYHGITDAGAALTPGAGQPHDPWVVTLPLPSAAARVSDLLSEEDRLRAIGHADRAIETLAERGFAPAAFFLDTAATSSGIYDLPLAWLDAIVGRVRTAGGLIVADEVQYGLGRSGSHFWGFERRGLLPDMVTLGKPIGNGYPMGVVIARRELVEAFQAQAGFFSTFGGNPVAAAAGLAVLDVIDRERLLENTHSTGEYLRRQLIKLAARHDCLGAVRGAGLMIGLEIVGADAHAARVRTQQIVNSLASRARVLIGSEGPHANILKLRPALAFRREHADLLVQAIGAAAVES